MSATIDRDRVKQLTADREAVLRAQTGGSRRHWEAARAVLPQGVPSSFQAVAPYPVFITHGKGSQLWDVDGNRYTDYHAGFGVMVMGHANPIIAEAIAEAARTGTHFAAPSDRAVRVATELSRRFRLPKVRFTNSGTESTLDAIRLARAFTGKDGVVKIEGSYHGHHDAVMMSVHADPARIGPADHPVPVPQTAGIPQRVVEMTSIVPFNDPDFLERHLSERTDVACMIIEPIMLNIGVVMPNPGYLEALREITARHGVLLIFDEVKTGATVAAGGVVERFGVVPDLVALAKASGGSTPGGAVLGTEEVMDLIESGTVKQLGTFNGNPLTMAAAEAALTRVMTPETYRRLDEAGQRLLDGCQDVCERYGLPAYATGLAAKGCVMFSEQPVTDYRSYVAGFDHDLNYLGWLYHMTQGVYMTPGADEQWTLTIEHTDEELDHYIAVFEQFAADVTR